MEDTMIKNAEAQNAWKFIKPEKTNPEFVRDDFENLLMTKNLSKAELDLLWNQGEVKTFKSEAQIVMLENKPRPGMTEQRRYVYILLQGLVEAHVGTPTAKILYVTRRGKGMPLGETEALAPVSPPLYLIATVETQALCLEQTVFQELLDVIPGLTKNLAICLAIKLQDATSRLETMLFRSATGRLADDIFNLSSIANNRDEKGNAKIPSLSQGKWANFLNMDASGLSKAMKTLSDAKIISRTDEWITILDYDALWAYRNK